MPHWLLLTALALGFGLNMGCNESFSHNVEAITHDSDPKELAYENLNQDGTTSPAPFGTFLPLSSASNPAPIPGTPAVLGPHTSGLTGGALNEAVLTFAPPVNLPDLTAGHVDVMIKDTAGIFYGPLPIDFAALQAHATPIGTPGTGTYATDSFQLGWGTALAALAASGNNIDTVNFVTGGAVAWAAPNLGPGSFIEVIYKIDQTDPATYPGSFMLAPDDEVATASPSYHYDGTYNINIIIQLRADPSSYTSLGLIVDAPTILANLVPVDAQEAYTTIGNNVLNPSLVGWILVGANLTGITVPYSDTPAMAAPTHFDVHFVGSQETALGSFEPDNPGGTMTTFTPSIVTATTDSRLQLHLFLFPKDTPGVPDSFLPIIVTEAYELRQRNLPAFRLDVTKHGTSIDPDPVFNIQMFVSQGNAHFNRDKNSTEQLWTPMPCDVLRANSFSHEQLTPLIHANEVFSPALPGKFSGTVLLIPKAFTGPWNYVRFLIYAPIGSEGQRLESTLAAFQLTITANAREL